MSLNFKHLSTPAYVSPDCEACKALTNVVICQSGDIEDLLYDGEDF